LRHFAGHPAPNNPKPKPGSPPPKSKPETRVEQSKRPETSRARPSSPPSDAALAARAPELHKNPPKAQAPLSSRKRRTRSERVFRTPPACRSKPADEWGAHPVRQHVRCVASPNQARRRARDERYLGICDVRLQGTGQAYARYEFADLPGRTLVYLNHGARLLQEPRECCASRATAPRLGQCACRDSDRQPESVRSL
jgi:hypothetical protein